MSILKAQVVIPNRSGLAKDQSVNTWHFGTTGVDDAGDAVSIANALGAVYGTGAARLTKYLAVGMAPANARIKVYRLNDPVPRVPLFDAVSPVAFGAVGADGLPGAVAACISFQAAAVSGLNQRRRKNRIFLGPLASAVIAVDANFNAVLSAAFMADCQTQLSNLWTASAAAATWDWVVYSPTIGLVGGSAAVHDMWVDNRFDTQQKRDIGATSRPTHVFV